MIQILSLAQSILYCFIFLSGIVLTNIYIDHSKLSNRNFTKDQAAKIKILFICILTLILVCLTYFNHCYQNQIQFLQCIYINPNEEELTKNIAIALFINTTLFLGGLHQELYNGEMKRKFLRFYKKQFQWDLFKKLFIVPLCVQIVYRAVICRVIDPRIDHPSFFVFYSGILFGLSHLVNFFKFGQKYEAQFSLKSAIVQAIYNTIFGLYISHIFSKSHTLISSIVIQVYANFMGYPQYFQILKGNTQDDRIKKSTLFYFCGVVGCLSCCLLL